MEITTIILAVIASTGFWSFLSSIINRKKSSKSAYHQMTLALVRDKLLHLCEKYIERGYITANEHEILLGLYDSYISGGGNGTIKHLFEEQVSKLEIR